MDPYCLWSATRFCWGFENVGKSQFYFHQKDKNSGKQGLWIVKVVSGQTKSPDEDEIDSNIRNYTRILI